MDGVKSLKTSSMMMLCGWHATGIYPDGENENKYNPEYVYDGYRYERPVKIIVVCEKMSMMDAAVQIYLFKGIPPSRCPDFLYATGEKKMSEGVYAEVQVPHWTNGNYDGDSHVIFKGGGKAFHPYCGVDLIFIDEEPTYPVFSECCRMMTPDGEKPFMFLTMCPRRGETKVVSFFTKHCEVETVKDGRYYTYSGWDQNPFFSEEEKKRLESCLKDWKIPARRYGYPVFEVGKK